MKTFKRIHHFSQNLQNGYVQNNFPHIPSTVPTETEDEKMWLTYSFFVTLCIVCTICLNRFGAAAPHMGGAASRNGQPPLFGENEALEWVNPCGGKFDPSLSAPVPSKNQSEFYDALLTSTNIVISGISDLKAISTTELPAWNKGYNNTYSFLPTTPENRPKKWYNDTQMYVAAFQFLYRKQLNYDQINNDGNAESEELRTLMNQAKSLLCEIEIFINVTMKGNKVKIFTRQEMSEILKFRSNGSHVKSVLETVDKMFTKAKFQQYITGLLPVIQKRKRIANLQTKNIKPINCKRLVDPIKQRRCRNKKRQNQARLNAVNGVKPTKKGSNLNNAARQRLNKNKLTNMANNKRKQQPMNKKPNATALNKKPKLQQQPKQTVLRKVRKEVKNNAIIS